MEKHKRLAAVGLLVVLAGCAVVGKDANGISIRHSAENNVMIQSRADEHCAFFGKKAVRVQQGDTEAMYLFRTRVSTFKCVRESDLPKGDGEKTSGS